MTRLAALADRFATFVIPATSAHAVCGPWQTVLCNSCRPGQRVLCKSCRDCTGAGGGCTSCRNCGTC